MSTDAMAERARSRSCAGARGQWLAMGCRVFACVAALEGCVSAAPIVVQNWMDPTAQTSASTEGRLIVYSATRVTLTNDSEYPVHTAYWIYASHSDQPREIANTSGLFGQEPSPVVLPPGQYRVKALAAGAGYVLVPVIIEAGRTTRVDLD